MKLSKCLTALKRFRIFSNLFDSQRVGTPILNEWTGVAVLCCHGKDSSYISTSKVIRSCRYRKYRSKLLMLFNLAFLMICKYCLIVILSQKKWCSCVYDTLPDPSNRCDLSAHVFVFGANGKWTINLENAPQTQKRF